MIAPFLRAALLLAGTLCATAHAKRLESNDQARENAWRAAQWAYGSTVDTALVRAAAQSLKGDAETRRLEQRWEDLTARLTAVDAMSMSSETLRLGEEDDRASQMQEQRSALRAELRMLDQEIALRAPAFADLLSPRILSSAEMQRLLDRDEGLLLIAPADDATYLFAVTNEGFEWFRSSGMDRERIAALVKTLIAGIAAPDPDVPAPTFDLAAAHALYRDLVAPADRLLASKKTLMIVTPGRLGAIPASLLVTDPLAAARPGSDTGWLIDRQALLKLPSVASLHSLRCLSHNRRATHAGCPRSGKEEAIKAREALATPTISLVGVGAPDLLGPPGAGRGLTVMKDIFLEERADTEKLRTLPVLPGARLELDGMKTLFGSRALIRAGQDATEGFVRTAPEVRSARWLLFATHGLLASEGGRIGQPGLVFTPPAATAASALDDGYLSAADVATLDLSASVVALSACNTAGSDNQLGPDGLASLARGFFFAGARALLVSHWDVDDDATAELMKLSFQGMDTLSDSDAALALRDAMRAIRMNPARSYWSKPRYWAAFTLLGDHR